MAKKSESSAQKPARIADNKKAAYNYFFEERFEAGMVLEGWEKVQYFMLCRDSNPGRLKLDTS